MSSFRLFVISIYDGFGNANLAFSPDPKSLNVIYTFLKMQKLNLCHFILNVINGSALAASYGQLH